MKIKEVTHYPTLKKTTFKGYLLGSYRYAGTREEDNGTVTLIFRRAESYSPDVIEMPLEMVAGLETQHHFLEIDGDANGHLVGAKLKEPSPDCLFSFSRSYNSKIWFVEVQS